MRNERALDVGEVAHREMNRQRGLRGAELLQFLAGRHGRRLHGGAREDHRLRHFGQRELGLEGGSRGGEGGHARRHVIGNAERIEAAHLLGNGAIERGIAGVDARHVLAFVMRGLDVADDFVEVHGGRIEHQRIRGRGLHDLLRHQRTRIETDRAGLDDLQSTDGDEVRCAGACAHEMNGHVGPIFLA